jgi:hypothetical protein
VVNVVNEVNEVNVVNVVNVVNEVNVGNFFEAKLPNEQPGYLLGSVNFGHLSAGEQTAKGLKG